MPDTIRLEHIRLTHVRVPLREPFAISNGVVSEKDGIVVEISADGITGLGEASPMAGSFYSHHTPDTTWRALTAQLVPLMNAGSVDLGGTWCSGVSDDPFAICGLDNAVWDLVARRDNVSLWEMLGGDGKRPIESGLAVGIVPTVQDLLDRIAHYLQADGYKRVKIKVQPQWDAEPLEAIRKQYPSLPLMVDANCAYGREHIAHIANWDRFGLMMIEQPLAREDLEGHALLASHCATPICLDEGAESLEAVEQAIALRAARIVNIKLQRLGGFAAARRVHDIAARAGIGCWMGTMPELAVGGWAAVHFATLPNIVYPTDVESSDRWFVADITNPPIRCQNGWVALPSGGGLGVELNREVVERYKVREWEAPLKCAVRSEK